MSHGEATWRLNTTVVGSILTRWNYFKNNTKRNAYYCHPAFKMGRNTSLPFWIVLI